MAIPRRVHAPCAVAGRCAQRNRTAAQNPRRTRQEKRQELQPQGIHSVAELIEAIGQRALQLRRYRQEQSGTHGQEVRLSARRLLAPEIQAYADQKKEYIKIISIDAAPAQRAGTRPSYALFGAPPTRLPCPISQANVGRAISAHGASPTRVAVSSTATHQIRTLQCLLA